MPDLTAQERLQPALLDRLTDEAPDKRDESRDQRVMSKHKLREAVLRDLAWLFNSTRFETDDELAGAPLVRCSVVNYGLPVLSGRAATSLDIARLEQAMRQSILDFEPRIKPETLVVRAMVDANQLEHEHNVIGVEISGDLWAQPMAIPLWARTEIDLETGRVELTELRRSQT